MKLKIFVIIALVAICAGTVSAQDSIDRRLDSLQSLYYKLSDSDTNKFNVASILAHNHYVADSAMEWSNRLVKLAKNRNNSYFESKGYYYMSLAYYHLGDYVKSSDCNIKSLMIAEQIGCRYHVAYNNAQLGNNNLHMYNYEQAIQYYLDALDIYNEMGDSLNIANCYRNIAGLYGRQKLYAEATRYFNMAITIDSLQHAYNQLSLDYLNLGEMRLLRFFFVITQHDSKLPMQAKADLMKALEYRPADLDSRFYVLYNLCKSMHVEIMIFRDNPERIKDVVVELTEVTNELHDVADRLRLHKYSLGYYLALANLNSLTGKFPEARAALDSVAPYVTSRNVTDLDLQMDFYLCSDIYYRVIGDFKGAYDMKSKYYEAQNSQILLDYAVSSVTKMEQDKHDSIMKSREEEQKHFRHLMFAILIVILMGAMFLIWGYVSKRRHNRVLSEKNELLETQKKAIDDQNMVITSSLNYASLIQKAVMPHSDSLVDMFGQYFVVYRPQQIVSGDFYWANTVGRFKVVVCADCTGHGVPGAFVSMLGISLLNEISSAINDGCESAGYILDTLRTKLMRSLGQNQEKYEPGKMQNKDGIDMALVMVDYDNMLLHYAGAMRPLWIMRNGELIKYKASRMPIGMYFGEVTNFADNVIDISDGDILYMFSDGITDQFGYVDPERKVTKQFSLKRLSDLIMQIHDLPMSAQKQCIEEAIDKWENGHRQIDDITVMGIKIM